MEIFYKNYNYGNILELVEQENNTGKMILINLIPLILMAFAEEVCFRSFLYRNLCTIVKKKWICIIFVNLLFGAGHIYQGLMGVLGTFVIGIVFSIEFEKHNNIYTISIFHALRNIIDLIIRAAF
jgi:membrane protease YdiL (CAAX protease family)